MPLAQIVSLAVLAAALAAGLPKPKIVVIESLLADCRFCGECEIVDLELPAGGDGAVTVRVTKDPGRIGRGFDKRGAELVFALTPGGSHSCAEFLKALLRDGESPLLVADDKQRITAVGRPLAGDARGLAWELRHFYDFNAAVWRTGDAALRKELGLGDWREKAAVTGRALVHMLGEARREQAARALPVLLPAFRGVTAARFRECTVALRADAEGPAERAAQELQAHGLPWLAELERMRERTSRARTKSRLAAIIDELEPFRPAIAWAEGARASGAAAEAALVLEALPRLDAGAREQADAHLRALGARLDPPVPADASDERAALLARLRTAVMSSEPLPL